MMRSFCLLLLLPLAACSQPLESQVAARLTEAGLPGPMADCMAARWVDRLSLPQLQKIRSLAEDLSRERGAGGLTVARFVERVQAVDDPEIFNVVAGSAAACALGG
jgi:hypothetical protein